LGESLPTLRLAGLSIDCLEVLMAKKLTKEQFNEIITLMENKQWVEAESLLSTYRNISDSTIDYLFGCIYNAWDNPNKDKEKAKKYFGRVIESKEPIEAAFVFLSDIEKNRSHSIRILQRGLDIFPKSEPLYFHLLVKTNPADRQTIYLEAKDKGAISDRIKLVMAEAHFDLEEYKSTLDFLEGIKGDTTEETLVLECIRGFSFLGLQDFNKSNEIFAHAIEEDLNHRLNYIAHLGLILNLSKQGDIEKAEPIAEEINPEFQIDPLLIAGGYGYAHLDATGYAIKALDALEAKSKIKKIKGIAKGLKGLLLYSEAFEDGTKKSLRREVTSLLEYANKIFPQNVEFCHHLFWIYSEHSKQPLRAWKFLVQYALNCNENDFYSSDFIESTDTDSFKAILSDFKQLISGSYVSKKVASTVLPLLIKRLCQEKRYNEVIELSINFNDLDLRASPGLFEIAYAFGTSPDLFKAEKYYEMYLRDFGDNGAVYNNLAVIYEKRGDLLKAKEYYQKAAGLDNNEKLYKKNLKRVEDQLREKDEVDFELREAAQGYQSESPYVQKKILDFHNQRNKDGLIICSYRQAPQYLKMAGPKAVEFLNGLLAKKYILKITDHAYNTPSNVYKLNPHLENEIAKVEEALEIEKDFLEMCDRLNFQNLELIGYNEDLLKNLSKLASDELRTMLIRDLRENAIAIILRQHKSALILSGSITEAILMDRVLASGIHHYSLKGDRKDVIKMDLNELLEVAEKEKIIDSTMAHLAHGVRGYRNLIHPGVEKRKGTIQVNESNVELSWNIVKKLLQEIK
jgi:tetratricopeptide (TPR) repeat protein